MLTFVEDRKQIKIFVHPQAKKVVEEFADKFDMKEIGVASRIYNWFGTLPLPVQKWITGLAEGNEGEGMRTFAQMLLGENLKIEDWKLIGSMVKRPAEPPTPPQAPPAPDQPGPRKHRDRTKRPVERGRE